MESTMNDKPYSVDLGTRFPVINVSRTLYYLVETVKFIFAFSIGLYISWELYHKCLFNPHCNSVAVGYFSLLALSCFGTCGIPLTKMDKSSLFELS